jgi:hypothetical protein
MLIRKSISDAHRTALEEIARPGTWLDGKTRNQVILESRHSKDCDLCQSRKKALSPYTIDGLHDPVSDLPIHYIEVIHRISNDSGRLTQSWFNRLSSEIPAEVYIEMLGIIACGVIIDTFAEGIGQELSPPLQARQGQPSRISNPNVIDAGAWLPILNVKNVPSDTGLPSTPNIARALGLVPSAIDLFFKVMRKHYSLSDMDFDLSRSQTEMLAARVSSLNQCFY